MYSADHKIRKNFVISNIATEVKGRKDEKRYSFIEVSSR